MPRFAHHTKLIAALAAWVVAYLALAPKSVVAADVLYLIPGLVTVTPWAQGYHLGRPAPLSALSLVDARARSLR